MGTGYVRNDTTNNIADGNVINAADLDGEFDAVEAAFNASTGHTHDGTASEGAPITVVGPAQEWVVDGTALYPKTDNTYDIGKSGAEIKDIYVDGTANIDALVADTADINGGTVDGATINSSPIGGSTPAAGAFTTLSATGNITLSGDIVTDVVIAEASPSITMTDTDTSTNAIISTDNSGSIRIRADDGNAAGASGISFEVDGTVVGSWNATEFTVSDTAPTIVLNDTNGASGQAQVSLEISGTSFAIGTRDNTGSALLYKDYLIGRASGAGATTHVFNILGTTVFDIDTNGVDVTGTLEVSGSASVGTTLEVSGAISTPTKVEVRGDGAYFDARAQSGTDILGFRLLDNADVQRAGFIWDEANTDALLQTYSSLGALVHEYDLTNANFDITTAAATNSGFNLSLNGTRRVTIDTDAIKTYATDGTTQVGNFPLGASIALAATGAYNLTQAGSANVIVTSDGLIRRSTSSGEFKINREPLGETGSVIDSLDPVSFESTHEGEQGNRYTGFIAEEVAAVYPEASADNGQNYDVRALVAILWKEVQDLRQRVAQLEAN